MPGSRPQEAPRRSTRMLVLGRSGFAPVATAVAGLLTFIVLKDPSEPLWLVPLGLLLLLLEHAGGVRYTEESMSWRNWVSWHRVHFEDIKKIIVDSGAGAHGAAPVVYLEVKGRSRRLKVLPTATQGIRDAERYAAALSRLTGAEAIVFPVSYLPHSRPPVS